MSGRSDISVGVIGGGIGGLAFALSSLQAGFDVHLYERASVLREVGAGIQVSPNASRVLHRLGLAAELGRRHRSPAARSTSRYISNIPVKCGNRALRCGTWALRLLTLASGPVTSVSRCGDGRRAGAGPIGGARQPSAERAERERRQRDEDQ